MVQITKDIVTWLQQWFYTEAEVDSALASKVNSVTFGFDTTNEELYVEVL